MGGIPLPSSHWTVQPSGQLRREACRRPPRGRRTKDAEGRDGAGDSVRGAAAGGRS